jgi:hypothetical protein
MRAFAIAAGLLAAVLASPAAAQVVVNGKLLSGGEIAWLAEVSCGPVYPGNYWLDMNSGYWGYAGSPRPMGHIRDRCGQRRVFRDGNMSREGRLFYPGEILNGY